MGVKGGHLRTKLRWSVLAGLLGVGLGLPAGASAQVGTGTVSGAVDHVARLEAITSRIDALEGAMADVASRVALLKDSALSGEVGRTHGLLVHRNRLGSAFRLVAVTYRVDGKTVLERRGPGLDRVKTIPLLAGAMQPGRHRVQVQARVESGTFGIFSYAEGYQFQVESEYEFRVREGRVNRLEVLFMAKPDITLPAEERLTVRYDVSLDSGVPLGSKELTGPTAPGDPSP